MPRYDNCLPRLNKVPHLSNGIGYIDFHITVRLRLIYIDLRLQKTPQEKVQRAQISRYWFQINVNYARDNHTLNSFMSIVAFAVWQVPHVVHMVRRAFLLKLHVIYVLNTLQLQLLTEMSSISFCFFEEVRTNDAASPKSGEILTHAGCHRPIYLAC